MSELLQQLGLAGAPLAGHLLSLLGELCAGAFDAGAQPDAGSSAYAAAAEQAMGAALRCLGPQAVLDVLPLNLKEGASKGCVPCVWMRSYCFRALSCCQLGRHRVALCH